ncbi:MAG TPA: STAS/SEC14 domain-containing protein [Labilithrix sp.]|nr:STAS/SEC14 domain-containing protein [Labilithrix sp.]
MSGLTTSSAEEWTRYVLALQALGKEHRQVALLVIADVGILTSPQREELARHAPKGIRTSVVTASTIARSIVSLLGWLDANIRAFSPSAIDAAFNYLAVPSDQRPSILRQVASMRVQVSGIGVDGDEAASALLERSSIEPMHAIATPLSKLRSELVSRGRT